MISQLASYSYVPFSEKKTTGEERREREVNAVSSPNARIKSISSKHTSSDLGEA